MLDVLMGEVRERERETEGGREGGRAQVGRESEDGRRKLNVSL